MFAAADGGLLWPSKAYRGYRAARKTAGVPNLPLHALRHTAVTLLLEAGAPLEVVARIIGHRNLSLTLDVYADLLPKASKRAAEALDRFLEENPL